MFFFIFLPLVYDTVTEIHDYQKICVWWVLKMLTDIHKQKCVASAQTILHHFAKEGDGSSKTSSLDMKPRFHTQMWSQNSRQCNGVLIIYTSKASLLCFKNHGQRFFLEWGIILIYFMESGKTTNVDTCCETLKKLRKPKTKADL